MQKLLSEGYLILRSVLSQEEVAELRKETDRLFDQLEGGGTRHICERSSLFARLARKLAELEGVLPMKKMRMVRSIYFNKTPDKNWPVAWHQDLSIAVKEWKEVEGYEAWSLKGNGVHHVRPPLCLLSQMWTVRLHLDATHAENGALLVIPESHKHGVIPSDQIDVFTDPTTICECHAGDVLVMSPLLLHASNKSLNPSDRRVLHFEFAPEGVLNDQLEWFESDVSKS